MGSYKSKKESIMSPHGTNEVSTFDSKLLELEYQYAAQNLLQYEDLRARLFQLYTILTGVVLAISPAQSIQEMRIPILLVLLVFGIVIVVASGRLRLLTISSYRAQALIRGFYIKHQLLDSRDDLRNALLWDESSIPSGENLTSHSFLTSFLAILLNSAVLGAILLFLSQPVSIAFLWAGGSCVIQTAAYLFFLRWSIAKGHDAVNFHRKLAALEKQAASSDKQV
jgi:hypothetical protein